MDVNFSYAVHMRDYCTQLKETTSFRLDWQRQDNEKCQFNCHFQTLTDRVSRVTQGTHDSRRNAGCKRRTSRQTDPTSLLQDSPCEVPHFTRLYLNTHSQVVVLMPREALNSDSASALPKLPSLHQGKRNMFICFKLDFATSRLKELKDT